jgi:F0F1-type ATP synthase assembly protein I
MILLDIFSSPIMSGAQLFLLIVCTLIGLGAGITAMDVRGTLSKKKKADH